MRSRDWLVLAGSILLALALRLLVLSAHARYPLGGDEAGFFEQARTFVQGRGYQDVELMRGPLYPLFLAVIFRLLGAEVGAARLVQALLSAATVPLLYLWAGRRYGPRAGLVAATLGALFFPLAVQSTTLLTETLFLFLYVLGMIALEWTLARPAWWRALGTGALFGLATLTRSVGLPLVGLAALAMAWTAAALGTRHFRESSRVGATADDTAPGRDASREREMPRPCAAAAPSSPSSSSSSPRRPVSPAPARSWRRALVLAALVLLGAALVILPWTLRNAVVYRALILVDTTGPTNLWLDNDPDLGRDRVKAELLKYPEGERSALAARNGLNAIIAHPGWFLAKCWREVRLFFSLEYLDDFRDRPAIWYPTAEVWARVLLGDGLYLLLVALGLIGLVRRPARFQPASGAEAAGDSGLVRALDLLWLAYLLVTAALFHVELRYRLPFLVGLVPYAAVVLAHPRATWAALRRSRPRLALAAVALLALAGLLLAHANYPLQVVRTAVKGVHLALGEGALARGDVPGAEAHARAALNVYGESSEARVLLAQALWRQEHRAEAVAALRQAIDYRSGHPHPHLLLGDMLRAQGLPEKARPELAYERNSLQDLQGWLWDRTYTPVPTTLDLGAGLELGYLRGWPLPETAADGTTFRWSDDRAVFRLAATGTWASTPRPGPAPLRLTLRMAAGRPDGLPLPQVEVWLDGARLGQFTVENGWHTYTLETPAVPPSSILLFELRSTTFRPHAYDPRLDDNRALGVMVDWVALIGYR